MPIILTLERSTEEEISGIPKFVTLTADAPSTIFYTLDGTDPDINSDMYVDVIVMPTTGLTVTLKAQAVSDLESSDVLEVTYSTDQSGLDRTRIVGDEGINILAPGETVVDSLAYDADGNLTQSTTVPVVDLDVKASTTNRIGEDISGNTTLDFVNLSDRTTGSVVTPISSPNDFADFDPQASMIIIDGTTQEKLDEQVVQIINRPYFTMELNDKMNKESMGNRQLVTSSLVRAIKNPKTGLITFYYRDSRENRWIKSNQSTGPKTQNISATRESSGGGLIFRWVENRAQTKIF